MNLKEKRIELITKIKNTKMTKEEIELILKLAQKIKKNN